MYAFEMIADASGIPSREKEVSASCANREHMRSGNNSADLPKHRNPDVVCVALTNTRASSRMPRTVSRMGSCKLCVFCAGSLCAEHRVSRSRLWSAIYSIRLTDPSLSVKCLCECEFVPVCDF